MLTPPKANSRDNDGLLEAVKLLQLKLNADLVVLSACNTAVVGKFGGDAFLVWQKLFLCWSKKFGR